MTSSLEKFKYHNIAIQHNINFSKDWSFWEIRQFGPAMLNRPKDLTQTNRPGIGPAGLKGQQLLPKQ